MMKHIRIGQETLIMVGEMKETIMGMLTTIHTFESLRSKEKS
ncbi:hypothetical protein OESDEN_23466 [Oesophagostomum dentatum]|uniref:Uncharacterized protein n=1 Tax=Oesophagostomum dentatum TaxID=61180 RepID=A0A0B1RW56_OESDE|nr:hypothetical protein OESDEN_23466 [Oesophagostomum dentatum]